MCRRYFLLASVKLMHLVNFDSFECQMALILATILHYVLPAVVPSMFSTVVLRVKVATGGSSFLQAEDGYVPAIKPALKLKLGSWPVKQS